MTSVLLVIHLFVTLAMIGVVLIQRSEGGGLGIGNSQGMGAFMGGRGTANLLTRTTAILAALFMGLSLALAILNRGGAASGRDLLAPPPATAPLTLPGALPGAPPAGPVGGAPATPPPAPATPDVPTK